MNEAIKLIKNILVKSTSLNENQIVIAQPGGDGYSFVYVIKNCAIIDIGDLCYETYIREFDARKMNSALVERFAQQAANYFNEPTKVKPHLIGNSSLLQGKYKEIAESYYFQ